MALRTVIVGGGIGGLSLARELVLRELPVTVLERAPKLGTVGAGIIMNPNAMAVLEGNGLAADVRAQSGPYLGRDTLDHRGRWLATRDYRPLYAGGRLVPGALVHRGHLQQCLYDGLPAGTVHFGVRLETLEAGPEGVGVETAAGEIVTGDVLVGADGIRSTVRARFFGSSEPVHLGYRSHRFVVRNLDGVIHFTEFLGRGQRVGLVPIGGGHLYVWTTFNGDPKADGPDGPVGRGGEERTGDPERDSSVPRHDVLERAEAVQACFAGFSDPRVRRAFGQLAPSEPVLCTDIEEIQQDAWVRAPVVLLGDAAHALTPNMGQGAGMAMEDAAVLADELSRAAKGTTTLPVALDHYVARRRARVATFTRLSRQVGEDGQQTGRLGCWLRNRRIAREGRAVSSVQAGLVRLLRWPSDTPAEKGTR